MNNNELYHAWLKKGEAADQHKYTRRVWRNGRWYYYYDDGTVTKDYPKGQNYKTKTDQQSTTKVTKPTKTESSPTTKSSSMTLKTRIEKSIESGMKAFNRMGSLLGSKVADLADKKDDQNKNSKPIGQNYTVKKR